jgi:uncharacterized membrane protein (UPF0127 family)
MIALAALLLALARTITLQAPNEKLDLEIADTYQSREHGLMYRTSLAPHSGMIFVFPFDTVEDFWMKNTLIPLDMIFVRSDGTIDSIAANVPASTLQTPDGAVATREGRGKYVIELAAGEAARAGLRAGLRLKIPKLEARDPRAS